MRNIARGTAVGTSVVGVMLPDGSGPVAALVDNHSGYWFQVHPGGDWVPPYTSAHIVNFGDTVPSVDVVAVSVGPSNQLSALTGDPVAVTVFDESEAPSSDTGNALAWLTPQQTGFRSLGSLSFLQSGPANQYTVGLLPTERAIAILLPVTGVYGPYSVVAQPAGFANPLQFAQSNIGPNAWVVIPTAPDLYKPPNPNPFTALGTIPWSLTLVSTGAAPLNGALGWVFALANLPLDIGYGRGQMVAAASMPVVLASDQSALAVTTPLTTSRTLLLSSGTLANAAGAASVQMLAAPGAGHAYRIFGMAVGINRGTTGNVDIVIQDNSPQPIWRAQGLSLAGQSNIVWNVPETGFACTTNQGLTFATNSSAVGGSALWSVFYTID